MPITFCQIFSRSFKKIIPINTPKTNELCVTGITLEISPAFKAKNKNNSKKPNKLPAKTKPSLFILNSFTIASVSNFRSPKLNNPITNNSKDANVISGKKGQIYQIQKKCQQIKCLTMSELSQLTN